MVLKQNIKEIRGHSYIVLLTGRSWNVSSGFHRPGAVSMNRFQALPGKEKMSKWVINYLISGNEDRRCRYRAILIEITSGAWQPCSPIAHALYVSSPWQVLLLSEAEWLGEYSGSCTNITRRIILDFTSSKRNRMYVITLTWSCKERIFPLCLLASVKTLASCPLCPWRTVEP